MGIALVSIILAWTAFVLGASLSFLNFYLSFLRYPFHRLRGFPKESFRYASGIPLFGSIFLGLALLGLHSQPGVLPVAIALAVIDTGGVVWIAGAMVYILIHLLVYGKNDG